MGKGINASEIGLARTHLREALKDPDTETYCLVSLVALNDQ
jgi:hypothetical protein